MRQPLLIIDVQPSFTPPHRVIDGIRSLIGTPAPDDDSSI
jgi:hypothetical protein